MQFPSLNLSAQTPYNFSLSTPAPAPTPAPYNFSLTTPAFTPASTFNLGFQPLTTPILRQTFDVNTFRTKLKHPVHTEQIRINSDSANKSYNGLYHNFILPAVGDYSFDFQLQSLFIFKGILEQNALVDALSNYIESVTLNLNNATYVIARADGFPRVDSKPTQELTSNPKSTLDLKFLNLPLLTKYVNESSYHVSVKFTQPPPMKYDLIYDVMFVDDKNYAQNLQKEEFGILYQSRQANNQTKNVELIFRSGRVSTK